MAHKLNRKAAEAYSEDFSHKILDNFYSSHQIATGQNILELTPVQQVNLLVIQRMYQRWQEEAMRMRSPYFNYEHPQVQESLQSFMNTLSRHIQVERSALEPLLQAAVLDTLYLLFNPMAYFDELLQRYHKPESLLAALRYLRMQQALTDVLQEQVEQKETTEGEYLLTMMEAGIRSGKIETDSVEEHSRAFEEVLAFPENLVEVPVEFKPEPPKEEEEAPDFFSSISRIAPRTPKPAYKPAPEPEAEPKAEQKAEPAAQPKAVPTPAPKPAAQQESAEEPQQRAPKAAETDFTPDHTATPQIKPIIPTHQVAPSGRASTLSASETAAGPNIRKQEEESHTLNTRFSQKTEKKPLYEKFETKEPRNTIAQKQRVTNIRHYITLNQRFMYIKELFGGNAAAFNNALDKLDTFSNLEEARQWVQENLATQPQWQSDSEAEQEFQRILELRFGS